MILSFLDDGAGVFRVVEIGEEGVGFVGSINLRKVEGGGVGKREAVDGGATDDEILSGVILMFF